MTLTTLLKTLLSLTLFSLSFQCLAEDPATIYKGVDAKGVTVYSNSPQGLLKVQKVKLPESPISGMSGNTFSDPNPAPQAPQSDLAAKRLAAQAAQQALDNAIKAQSSGQEPLPGERTGTAGGGSRLNEAYFERQKSLVDAVTKAQADADADAASQ